MGEAAVKAAKAVGYYNAGTVEFIYQDGEFFFLEMNTRLQVEHPVTEMITDIDLVEWQIRVAAGEPLPMTQDEVNAARRGHSIEVRINAEDPTDGKFLPSPGPITKLVAPDGFGVRFDTGYQSGDRSASTTTTSSASSIVWGRDRRLAIARTIRALEEMMVEGVATTIPADLAILRHPDFAAVEHSTKWVEETARPAAASRPPAARAERRRRRTRRSSSARRPSRSTASASTSTCGCPSRPVVAAAAPAAKKAEARLVRRRVPAPPAPARSRPRCRARSSRCSSRSVRRSRSAPGIVVLEAMKMENQINADKAGTVKEIKVAAGDTVGGGDVVAVIE